LERIDILKETDLFRDVPVSHLPGMVRYFEKVVFKDRTKIFSDGDKGDYLYLIGAGNVSVILNIDGIGEEEVAILKPFDFFGEMALIDGGVRSASAFALKDTELLRISGEDFGLITARGADSADIILRNIINKLSKRIRSTSDKLNNFYLMDMGV